MDDKQSKIRDEVVYQGSMIGALWYLFLDIGIKHLGGLLIFTAFLILTKQPWTLGLIAYFVFVALMWVTELVFHSHRG